jgi:hypothetical protein
MHLPFGNVGGRRNRKNSRHPPQGARRAVFPGGTSFQSARRRIARGVPQCDGNGRRRHVTSTRATRTDAANRAGIVARRQARSRSTMQWGPHGRAANCRTDTSCGRRVRQSASVIPSAARTGRLADPHRDRQCARGGRSSSAVASRLAHRHMRCPPVRRRAMCMRRRVVPLSPAVTSCPAFPRAAESHSTTWNETGCHALRCMARGIARTAHVVCAGQRERRRLALRVRARRARSRRLRCATGLSRDAWDA